MFKTLAYNVANFFGTNGMSWNQPVNVGVEPPNVNTFRYEIDGSKIHLALDLIDGTAIGNRVNSFLGTYIPEGKWGGYTCQVGGRAKIGNGLWEPIYCIVTEYSPLLLFRRQSEVDWPAAPTKIRLDFNETFEVIDPF